MVWILTSDQRNPSMTTLSFQRGKSQWIMNMSSASRIAGSGAGSWVAHQSAAPMSAESTLSPAARTLGKRALFRDHHAYVRKPQLGGQKQPCRGDPDDKHHRRPVARSSSRGRSYEQ
jgi:hypothetical protein